VKKGGGGGSCRSEFARKKKIRGRRLRPVGETNVIQVVRKNVVVFKALTTEGKARMFTKKGKLRGECTKWGTSIGGDT